MLMVSASGLLMGAWHASVIIGLALGSVSTALLFSFSKSRLQHPTLLNAYSILWGLSAVFTLTMICPIPIAWTDPDNLKIAQLLNSGTQFGFLSYAPYQTALRLLQILTAFCLFLIVCDQEKHRQYRQAFVVWMLVASWAFILLSLDHPPLVNRNHVARIFGLLSILCFVLESESKPMWQRYALFATAVISGAFVYLTQSRWGIIAYTLSLLLFLRSWHFTFAILCGASLLGYEVIRDRLLTLLDSQSYFGKIELYKQLPQLIQEHWLWGIGQGALPVEYHKHVQPNFHANELFSAHYRITYLENTTLQTLIDHGLLKGGVLIFLTIWILYRVSKINYLYTLPFLFLWLADWADFSFESGTVVYLCAIFAAISPLPKTILLRPGWLTGILACVVFITLMCLWFVSFQGPVNDLEARYAFSHKSKPWLEFALHRRPTHFSSRLQLARTQWKERDYPKALATYRLAAASAPNYLGFILREIAPIAPSYVERRQVLPDDSLETLNMLCSILPSRECYQDSKNWQRLVEIALQEQDPESALLALSADTKGNSPDGFAAVCFAQILVLQQGLAATLEQTREWPTQLKSPCELQRWRIGALPAREGLLELETMKMCFENWEIEKIDLYERDHQTARALELTLSLLGTYPDNLKLQGQKKRLQSQLMIPNP